MNKNTLIAIILSTVVVAVSFILQPILFPGVYEPEQPVNEGYSETEQDP